MNNILVNKEGHITILSLNRANVLNAFNSEMLVELTEAVKAAGQDPDTYVIVINSSLEKAFTAGGDIKEESLLTYETADNFSTKGQGCSMAIYNSPIPVILAINGYALGGGLELTVAADITIATKDAKIGIPTINLGGIPCWAGTQLLPRIVGHSVASDILLTGRVLSAEECYRLHLVQYLTEKEELMEKAMEVANTIADKSPWAVKMMRRSIKEGLEMPLRDALALERDIFRECYLSSDREEATAAFLEKREHKPYNNRRDFV